MAMVLFEGAEELALGTEELFSTSSGTLSQNAAKAFSWGSKLVKSPVGKQLVAGLALDDLVEHARKHFSSQANRPPKNTSSSAKKQQLRTIGHANNLHNHILRRSGARQKRPAYGKPNFTNVSGSIGFTHTEFLTTITESDVYSMVLDAEINPREKLLFPWLNTLSDSFDEFRVNSLSLNYHPVRGTDQDGEVTFSYNQDPDATTPTNRREELQQNYSKSIAAGHSANVNIPIKGSWKKIHPDANDQTTSHSNGRLWVSTIYSDATSDIIGEITATYSVEFKTPTSSDNTAQFYVSSSTEDATIYPFDGAQVEATRAGANFVAATSAGTLTFYEKGEYYVNLYVTGSGLSIPSYSGTSTVATNADVGSSYVDAREVINSGVTEFNVFLYCIVSEYGQTLIFSGTASTTTNQVQITVTKTNNKAITME